jgi:hypothetical protein
MKTKTLLLCVVSILIIGLAGGVYWWWTRPQVIKFSDDSKLILLGVDYGKRHVVPGGKLSAARTTPATPAARGGRGGVNRPIRRTFNTPSDTLVVWARAKYDYTPNQYLNFQMVVYDKAGTACAQAGGAIASGSQSGDDVFTFQFDAFPRREGSLYLRAQESYNGGNEMGDNKFIVANPAASKSFTKWTPEPMPDKQTDGDLAVTLTKLVSGVDTPYLRNQDDPDDAMNKGVQVAYRVERNGKPVKSWAPASLEFSDATGNRTAMNYYNPNGAYPVQWNGDEGGLTNQNGLWPDEPAWKVRMEMTQNSDFSSDDEWTATNIPVVLGNQQSFNGFAGRPNQAAPAVPFAEADLNGHHIKIFPAVQFTNFPARPANLPANVVFTQPQQTGLMIQIQPAVVNYTVRPMNVMNGMQVADDGMRMALAKITDGEGGEIQSYNSGSSSSGTVGAADSISTFRYTLRDTTGVTNLNATITIHKNRFFEFTVKPQKAPNDQP